MSSCEIKARFLHQNKVNFASQRNKMAANLDLFRVHLHRQPNANTKLDLCLPLLTAINTVKFSFVLRRNSRRLTKNI